MREFFDGLTTVAGIAAVAGFASWTVFNMAQCSMTNEKNRYEYLSTVDRTESHEYNSSPVRDPAQ